MLRWQAILVLVIWAPHQSGESYCNSYKGKAPPELAASPEDWLNAEEAPQLAKLKGRVVWLELSILTCDGCEKSKPRLVKLHKSYAHNGLVVLDVNNGKIDGKEDLKRALTKGGISFPVLWDRGGENCARYGVKAYPVAYLIGASGDVVWEGPSTLKEEEMDRLVRQELDKIPAKK